jgi:hypothetical protein
MGDVVISYGQVYLGFKESRRYWKTLVPCVEKCWRECEQPLSLLAYALHPQYATHVRALIEYDIPTKSILAQFVIYYYRRFISRSGYEQHEFVKWVEGSLTYVGYAEFVSYSEPLGTFWNHMRGERVATKLPDLALAVLSIAVNTAPYERLFSEFGLIQTAIRNRVGMEKVRQIAQLRNAIRARRRARDAKMAKAKKTFLPKSFAPTHAARRRHVQEGLCGMPPSARRDATPTKLTNPSGGCTCGQPALVLETTIYPMINLRRFTLLWRKILVL